MEIVSALEHAYSVTCDLVDRLGLDRAAPAPAASECGGPDVRATLNRLLRSVWMFTIVNAAGTPEEGARDLIGDDPRLALAVAVRENLASWRQPGAFDGLRSYAFGTFRADIAVLMNLEEVVVHNWLIVSATGVARAGGPDGPLVAAFAGSSRREG